MIKKIIIGSLLINFIHSPAQKYSYGLQGGFDLANLQMTNKPASAKGFTTFHPLATFNVNGYFGYRFSRFVGISAEPGFIRKGGTQDVHFRFLLNYIQLPVLADIFFTEKLFLSVGPEFSYLINARGKSKTASNDITSLYDNRYELSGLIGLNYHITKNIDAGLRYDHGFTYISKIIWTNEYNQPVGESKQYNQYFQLFVRIRR